MYFLTHAYQNKSKKALWNNFVIAIKIELALNTSLVIENSK